MQPDFLKFRKVITSIACSPLMLISNNSELAAKYLSNDSGEFLKAHDINVVENNLNLKFDKRVNNIFLLADNTEQANTENNLKNYEFLQVFHEVGKFPRYAFLVQNPSKKLSLINNT